MYLNREQMELVNSLVVKEYLRAENGLLIMRKLPADMWATTKKEGLRNHELYMMFLYDFNEKLVKVYSAKYNAKKKERVKGKSKKKVQHKQNKRV